MKLTETEKLEKEKAYKNKAYYKDWYEKNKETPHAAQSSGVYVCSSYDFAAPPPLENAERG